MSQVEVRRLQGEELLEAARLLQGYAFRSSPPLPEREEVQGRSAWIGESTHVAAFAGGEPVALVASAPMTQQVRGKLFSMGGLWGVAAHPAARRKGHTRLALAEMFAALRESSTSLSCLYAFRESFYDRLGYVALPQARIAKFSPQPLVPLVNRDLGGEVELSAVNDRFDEWRAYLRQVQRRMHGFAIRSDAADAEAGERRKAWLALARVDGQTVGTMLYQLELEKEGFMRVWRFYYDDSRARYLLLEWLARHADQVREVELRLPPCELPDTWFPDLAVTFGSCRPPMGRVIDVAALRGMETGPGRIALRVRDPHCPWNEGCYGFETVEGVLCVEPVDEADCTLAVNALAALVYGTHDPGDFAFRGWGDPAPAVQDRLRAMFPRRLPHVHEQF